MVRDAIRDWLALEAQRGPQSPSDAYFEARERLYQALLHDDRPLSDEEQQLAVASLSMAQAHTEALEAEVGRVRSALCAVRRQARATLASAGTHVSRFC